MPTSTNMNLDYAVIRSTADLDSYLFDHYPGNVATGAGPFLVAHDTESLPDGPPDYAAPYCLTLSMSPYTGRLIYARDTALIDYYRYLLTELNPVQLFHNYLHDINPFDQFQIPVPLFRFRDTMVMAYNLCLGGGGDDESGESKFAGRGSLGLKQLTYRHCGMKMSSFRDTVWPHSVPKLMEYLKDTAGPITPAPKLKLCVCGHTQPSHEPRGKTQRRTGYCFACRDDYETKIKCLKFKAAPPVKPTTEDKQYTSTYKKLINLIEDWEGGDKPALNPWDRIKGWNDEDRAIMQEVSGPWPVPSIAHVPESDLLHYAVSDADGTLRLYHYLTSLNSRANRPWLLY